MSERLVAGVLGAAVTVLAAYYLARHPSPPVWMRLIAVLAGYLGSYPNGPQVS